MISAVVVTYHEGTKLDDCLHSLQDFVKEIILVDMAEEKLVADLAKKYKAKLHTHPHVEYVEQVRNFAIAKSTFEWVLVLDPDERVTKSLKEELKRIMKEDTYVAVNIPRKNIFFGRWIAHTNFWPDRQIRFFKKSKLHWPEIIHTYPQVDGKIVSLPAKEKVSLVHYGYASFREFIGRQKRYAKVQAENNLRSGQRFSLFQLVWKPTREFLVRFVKHKAFLDGKEGLFLVGALMYYQMLVQWYILQKQR